MTFYARQTLTISSLTLLNANVETCLVCRHNVVTACVAATFRDIVS